MPTPLFDTYAPPSQIFERGEGAYLIERGGEKYLDFISGIAVNALGHAHPKAVAALKSQAEKLWHTSNMFTVPGQIELAAKYCKDSFADRVFFTNSGTEAVECAIKTARHYHYAKGRPDRYRIITFTGASMAARSARSMPAETLPIWKASARAWKALIRWPLAITTR